MDLATEHKNLSHTIVLAVFLKLTIILTLMAKTDGCKEDEGSQVRAGLMTEFPRQCQGHLCFKGCTGERTPAPE